jgi:HK97 family phage portal protein
MGWFRSKKEKRAEESAISQTQTDEVLLRALLGSSAVTKEEALNIPSVKSCINFVADTVAMLPIKLYRIDGDKTEEIKDDPRTWLLNNDTKDTLDAVQFWRAIIRDYYLGKGGYAYIEKDRNRFTGLYYVDESQISINPNTDPIHKDYDIYIQGKPYKPYEFLKILRNSKDGAQGVSITEENSLILSVAYNTLKFEETLVKKGGNKKGFLKAARKLSQEAVDSLKAAWNNLYSNNSENVVILNDGIDFKEASNSSVEMQLNENKETNSGEVCRIFNISENITKGTADDKEYAKGFKMGVLPVLTAIECALNRDFLLEKEKKSHYYAFDTKEMLKGSIKERFDAYKVAIDSNFMQIDEVRYMEDLPALGINWVKLGLDSVLYDPKAKTIYTPNTDKTATNLKGDEKDADRNQE